MANVRIKDVAKHAGVSVATITRVINNSDYVSDETRRRVMRSVKELGYIPNRMASALKNNNSRILGNVMPYSRANSFFSKLSATIDNLAGECDYHVLSMFSRADPKRETQLIRELMGRMTEAIIFTAVVLSEPEAVQQVLDKNIPVIMIERPLEMPGVDKVLIDDYEGSSAAAGHFLAKGHTRIGFIGCPWERHRVERNRYEGFYHTLVKHGRPPAAAHTLFVEEYEYECGYDAMKRLVNGPGRLPTACLISSDVLACGALQYLYEAGLRVPEDISLIGYDNTAADLCAPPLTTIAFPYEEIGKTVLSLFFERKNEKRDVGKSVMLSPYLLERSSVRSLSAP